MRIGLDVSKAIAARDGIGTYTVQLLQALLKLIAPNPEEQLRLYGLPRPRDRKAFNAAFPDLPPNAQVCDRLWPQSDEVDVFHCTAADFPIAFRGARVATCSTSPSIPIRNVTRRATGCTG